MPKAQHAARYRDLPSLLRQVREDADLTQRDLAKKLRMTHVAIHRCETGDRRVDLPEFVDWLRVCGVDPVEGLKRYMRSRGI